MEIYFASGNKNKLIEASKILADNDIEIKTLLMESPEIQSDDLEEVAIFSVKYAFKEVQKPVFIEDSGLFIEALNGFPGPYSSYVYRTLGNDGILKLMENEKNRNAVFISAIAYSESDDFILTFKGESYGQISFKILEGDNAAWGYDPIFIPKEGDNRSYAQMGIEEKNKVSHRKKSLEQFGEWFKNNRM